MYHEGVKIGKIVDRIDSGPVDASLIKLDRGYVSTGPYISDGALQMRVIGAEYAFDPSEIALAYRCVTYGQSTTTCGNLSGPVNAFGNTSVRRINGVGLRGVLGDSGSPAWCPIPSGGTGVVASGILIGTDSFYAYYGHIASAEFYFLVRTRAGL